MLGTYFKNKESDICLTSSYGPAQTNIIFPLMDYKAIHPSIAVTHLDLVIHPLFDGIH